MLELKWSDDLTDTEKRLYMAHIALTQLVDHVTKGAESRFYIYADGSSYGPEKDYSKALEIFDSLDESINPCIMLATRISTAVTLISKGKAYDDSVNFVGIRDV